MIAQRSSDASARTARWRLAVTAPAVLGLFALWLLSRPYPGIGGDAVVYMGRAVADLDPAGVGRELDFVRDGQSGFSVFRPMAAAVLGALGPAAGAMAIALAGLAVWLAGAAALFSRFAKGARLWAALACLAALPPYYGRVGVFQFGEAIAIPRVFAEALAMAALALLVSRPSPPAGGSGVPGEDRDDEGGLTAGAGALHRTPSTTAWSPSPYGGGLAAFALIAASFALHPIMAIPAAGVALLLLAMDDRRWLAVAGVGAAGLIAAAAAGAPVADRLFQSLDPAWRTAVHDRTGLVFPQEWSTTSFALLGCELATLVLVASVAKPRLRRLIVAVAAVGVAGPILSVAWPSLLIIQLQTWRSLWLVAVLATGGLALAAPELWRRGGACRAALAVIAIAWTAAPFVEVTLGASAAALGLRFWPASWRLPGRVADGLVAFAIGIALAVAALKLTAGASAYRPLAPGVTLTLATFDRVGALTPIIAGLALALAIGAPRLESLATRTAVWAGALVLALAAALLWDTRAPFTRAVEAGEGKAAFQAVAPAGDVLWLESFGVSWLMTGRPEWWSAPFQGASLVFDRGLAMEWQRRRAIVVATGLETKAFDLHTHWPPPSLTRAALTSICRADGGPASVVAPEVQVTDRALAAQAGRWRAPAPDVEASSDRKRLIVIRDFLVFDCARWR